MMLYRGIRDQEEHVDTVESMFQRSGVVIVSFPNNRSSKALLFESSSLSGLRATKVRSLIGRRSKMCFTVPPPIPPEAGKIPTWVMTLTDKSPKAGREVAMDCGTYWRAKSGIRRLPSSTAKGGGRVASRSSTLDY
jgi:hypothetical protein